jgi:hypothetical protein
VDTWTNLFKEGLFGPPLPPLDKIEKVIGVRDVDLFLNSGRETAAISLPFSEERLAIPGAPLSLLIPFASGGMGRFEGNGKEACWNKQER